MNGSAQDNTTLPKLPNWTVIGFTGHRNIADPAAVSRMIGAAIDQLEAPGVSLLAVCSAARGGDTLFIEETIRRSIPFVIILPFSMERFRKDFEADAWERLQLLMRQALRVEHLDGQCGDDEAYMEAGVGTIDRANVVIAVWEGEPARGLGGTADVVAYARALRKPLLLINPAMGQIIKERLDPLPATVAAQAPLRSLTDDPCEIVRHHFEQLDHAATRQGPRSRHLILWYILLHLVASARWVQPGRPSVRARGSLRIFAA